MNAINEQHNKMLHLMNWKEDRLNESYAPTKTIELTKTGADGKTYAIIREANRYCLKVTDDASKKNNAEAYMFVEGFRSRDKYSYNSYAEAIKDMDLKMYALNEAYAKDNEKAILIETTNPDYKERLVVEGTESLRNEIARQRQIMANAMLVSEGDNKCCYQGVGMGPVGHGKPFGDKSLETNEVGDNNGFPEKPAEEPFNADGTPKGSNDPDKPFTKEVPGSITKGGKPAMEPVRMDEGEDNADDSLQVIDIDNNEEDTTGEETSVNLEEPAGEETSVTLGDEESETEGDNTEGEADNTEGDDATAEAATADDFAAMTTDEKLIALFNKIDAVEKRLNDEDFEDDTLFGEKDNEGETEFSEEEKPEDGDNDEDKNAMQEALARQLAKHPRFQQILKEEKARFAREQFLARRRNRK